MRTLGGEFLYQATEFFIETEEILRRMEKKTNAIRGFPREGSSCSTT
ncbi:MAG: hypothetical protein K0Q73_8054 [Paenibacillus sp.]|jgi:hypothetical protein|nr:hypothetical protein [Paenibacillus sp.]